MVLVVGNNIVVKKSPTNLEHFLHASSRLVVDVNTFKGKRLRALNENHGLLYIEQHEYAVTYPGDPNVTFFGSEDATTCHVMIFREPMTGVTAMAHVDIGDECGRRCIESITEEVFNVSEEIYNRDRTGRTLEVSIVGGFDDEDGISQDLSLSILRDLVESNVYYILGLCCIGSLNTKIQGNEPYPVFYGCAIDVQNGDIFPARFPKAHGPEDILRHVRCTFNRDESSKDIHSVYDWRTGVIEIQPFKFQYNPAWLTLWCEASSKDILENLSTSPKVEPDYFVPTLKAAMKLILNNPRPLETVFKGGKSLRFKRINNCWVKIEDHDDTEAPTSTQ